MRIKSKKLDSSVTKKNQEEIVAINQIIKTQMHSLDSLMPTVGWIRAYRTALALTRPELARKLGKDVLPQSIYKFEQAESKGKITLQALCKLSEALNLKVYYALINKEVQVKITDNPNRWSLNNVFKLVRWKEGKKITKKLEPLYVPENGFIYLRRNEQKLTCKALAERVYKKVKPQATSEYEESGVNYKISNTTMQKVKPQAISEYEESEVNYTISITTMQKVAKALDCKFIYIIK